MAVPVRSCAFLIVLPIPLVPHSYYFCHLHQTHFRLLRAPRFSILVSCTAAQQFLFRHHIVKSEVIRVNGLEKIAHVAIRPAVPNISSVREDAHALHMQCVTTYVVVSSEAFNADPTRPFTSSHLQVLSLRPVAPRADEKKGDISLLYLRPAAEHIALCQYAARRVWYDQHFAGATPSDPPSLRLVNANYRPSQDHPMPAVQCGSTTTPPDAGDEVIGPAKAVEIGALESQVLDGLGDPLAVCSAATLFFRAEQLVAQDRVHGDEEDVGFGRVEDSPRVFEHRSVEPDLSHVLHHIVMLILPRRDAVMSLEIALDQVIVVIRWRIVNVNMDLATIERSDRV